jgi:hypothetical protein
MSTKKRESNAFANILGVQATPASVAPVPMPVTDAVSTPTTAAPRGRGRPRTRAEAPQTTTIRLSPDNHQKVRQLALRDRVAMNTLVLTALSEYCERRGIRLDSELMNSLNNIGVC